MKFYLCQDSDPFWMCPACEELGAESSCAECRGDVPGSALVPAAWRAEIEPALGLIIMDALEAPVPEPLGIHLWGNAWFPTLRRQLIRLINAQGATPLWANHRQGVGDLASPAMATLTTEAQRLFDLICRAQAEQVPYLVVQATGEPDFGAVPAPPVPRT